jgi:hypothetical protein
VGVQGHGIGGQPDHQSAFIGGEGRDKGGDKSIENEQDEKE